MKEKSNANSEDRLEHDVRMREGNREGGEGEKEGAAVLTNNIDSTTLG